MARDPQELQVKRASRDPEGLRDLTVTQDQLVPQALLDLRGRREMKVPPDPTEILDHLGLPEVKVCVATKDQLEHLERGVTMVL